MPVSLHLVSMPWAAPYIPSIQTGVLKAYVDSNRSLGVPTRTYSPFFTIRHKLWGAEFSSHLVGHAFTTDGEYPYMLAYLKRFGLPGVDPERATNEILDKLKASHQSGKWSEATTQSFIGRLEKASVEFVEQELIPSLRPRGLNVIGFTMNYDQIYSSLFCAKVLLTRVDPKSLVLLFGGKSASLPEVATVMTRLNIPGYLCMGEGEVRLKRILSSLRKVELAGRTPKRVHEAMISAAPGIHYSLDGGENLFTPDKSLFNTQLEDFKDIPSPDFTDFFSDIGRILSRRKNEHITFSLPIEGSRGCFAKCDFCGFNQYWKGFRKAGASEVLERTLELLRKHGPAKIEFMDNICDTWAEGYADELIRRRMQIPAALQLRVHHPEALWTKLKLSGANRILIGVEAISGPLLTRIAKGTKVYQNVAAYKHLNELRVDVRANLITHYPHSTLDDVAQTRQVLELVSHLKPFNLQKFRTDAGSPFYEKLSEEEKRALGQHVYIAPPKSCLPYMIGIAYDLPEKFLPREVHQAWSELTKWYASIQEDYRNDKNCRGLSVTRKPSARTNALHIEDRRFGKVKTHVLKGDTARIYDLCHGGVRSSTLASRSGLEEAVVVEILNELISKKLILSSDGFYLSLATRPASELISNLEAVSSEQPCRTHRAPSPASVAVPL